LSGSGYNFSNRPNSVTSFVNFAKIYSKKLIYEPKVNKIDCFEYFIFVTIIYTNISKNRVVLEDQDPRGRILWPEFQST
jgi:hypothetical protein